MSRWIAYDDAVARALAQRYGARSVQHAEGGHDAVLSALVTHSGAAVALLPAGHGQTMMVTRRPSHAATADAMQPRAYAATGFLGLQDEPIYDEEPVRSRSWWERLWE